MQTTLDRFGRVIIPKALRDELGLQAGETLEVETQHASLVIRHAKSKGGLVRKKGMLVFTGKLLRPMSDPVKDSREDRDRAILKGFKT